MNFTFGEVEEIFDLETKTEKNCRNDNGLNNSEQLVTSIPKEPESLKLPEINL